MDERHTMNMLIGARIMPEHSRHIKLFSIRSAGPENFPKDSFWGEWICSAFCRILACSFTSFPSRNHLPFRPSHLRGTSHLHRLRNVFRLWIVFITKHSCSSEWITLLFITDSAMNSQPVWNRQYGTIFYQSNYIFEKPFGTLINIVRSLNVYAVALKAFLIIFYYSRISLHLPFQLHTYILYNSAWELLFYMWSILIN